MQDVRDISITINSSTDTWPWTASTSANVVKVSREGIGLRIVDVGTFTMVGEDIGTYQYRAYNPSASIPPGASITLGAAGGGPVLYTRNIFIGETVAAGLKYSIDIDGAATVTYTSVSGDTTQDVANALASAINALSLSFPIGATVTPFLDEYYITVTTGGVRTYTVELTSPYYWVSKSGLFWVYLGVMYVFEQLTGVETIPALPTITGPYDFVSMTAVTSGLASYLYDASYPVVDTFEDNYAVGVASVENVPNAGSTTLLSYDVVIDDATKILKFGSSFIAGSPERVTVIYK